MAFFLKGFAQNPTSNFIAQKSPFFDQSSTENIRRKPAYLLGICAETTLVPSIYKKKGYYELIVLLSMLSVHLFVHTRECESNAQVGVEPVYD